MALIGLPQRLPNAPRLHKRDTTDRQTKGRRVVSPPTHCTPAPYLMIVAGTTWFRRNRFLFNRLRVLSHNPNFVVRDLQEATLDRETTGATAIADSQGAFT